MEPEQPYTVRQLLVGGRDEAAVAERKQVLRREEAEGRGNAGRRDSTCAESLRRVFDQRDAEPGERLEIGGPPKQVHGHDRPRPLRHPGGDVLRVDIQRHRVDIGEDRRRAGAHDRLRRRVEGERRADHLVAGADLQRVQHEHQRIRSVGDADRLRDAEVGGRLLFEGLHVRSQDERAGFEHFLEPAQNLRNQALVLRPHVNEGDRHREPV